MRDFAAIALQYAEDVVSGAIPAGRIARGACARQLKDLKRATFPWKYEPARGVRVCRFLENLPHIKGKWKTKTIVLEPWQVFIVMTLFCWVDANELRRFRTAYIEVPRKNAKTTLSAGISLYLLCEDGEPGAEIYSAAVTKDQARISWEIAKAMVKKDRDMMDHYGIQALAHSITIQRTGSYFKPLARDADSLEGLNPHGGCIDELHAHKTREVFDVLNVATGSRLQSLLWAITTAGENKTGICYEQHDYIDKIVSGHHSDDRYFGIVYGPDKEDDWTLEETWRKCNPNYGVSVFPDEMRSQYTKASQSPAAQANFQMKRTNAWLNVGEAYFNMLAWERLCKDETLKIENFVGIQCVFTVDLASKRDLTTRIAGFQKGGHLYLFGKHYLPESALDNGMPNYDIYRGWKEAGWLTVTDGDITDYNVVEADIVADSRMFKPVAIGFDPKYNAAHLMTRLQEKGLAVVEVPQTVVEASEPMKTLDAWIVAGRVHHNGDPILAWAIGNVVAKEDVKGNVYPRKTRDINKIDPAVASIMNMNLQLRHQADDGDFSGAVMAL